MATSIPRFGGQFLAQAASELPEWPVPQQQLYPAGTIKPRAPDHVLLKSGPVLFNVPITRMVDDKVRQRQNISVQAWHFCRKTGIGHVCCFNADIQCSKPQTDNK
ncbi:MAG: hypothetical protein CM1200mP30_03500 [Pseudomonadota bacterium]|nr:MAG: hypothetical protein CM1200mP30_03500 [Pseudomonadota bacterium]